jgi:HPt (histidine-containing phosphotransfer) domain-containing protein
VSATVFDIDGFLEAALIDRLSGDRELAGAVEDMPKQLATLKQCIAAGKVSAAGRQAHRIQGAAASVSGVAFERVAREIDRDTRAGDLESMAARLCELDRQFSLTREAMENIRKGAQARNRTLSRKP